VRRPDVDPIVEMDKASQAMERAERAAAALLLWPRESLTTPEQRRAWDALQVACMTCRAPRGKPCRSGSVLVKPCGLPHANRRSHAAGCAYRDRMGR